MYGKDRMRGGRGGGSAGRSFAPVKVGEELDVKIEAVGEKGDGVAKVKGFVLFVPNVKEGQTVKIRVTRVLSKVGFAEVVGAGEKFAEAPSESADEEETSSESYEDTEDFGEDSEQESEQENSQSDDQEESQEE